MRKFEIRLAKQQCENRAHLENLYRFIDSGRVDELPQEQAELMMEQAKAMLALDRILRRRMELLGLPCR